MRPVYDLAPQWVAAGYWGLRCRARRVVKHGLRAPVVARQVVACIGTVLLLVALGAGLGWAHVAALARLP